MNIFKKAVRVWPRYWFSATLLALLVTAFPTRAEAEQIAVSTENWKLSENGAEMVTFQGRQALKLNRGNATFTGEDFYNGLIEFDLWMPKARGFGGLNFRADGKNSENFYLRPHLSGMPDANQYMPVFNNNSAWQILHGARYSAPTTYNHGSWIKVKLAIKDDKMDIYIDSEEPVLHIEDLLLNGKVGKIVLYGALIDFHFSNIRITPTDDVILKGKAEPLAELPATRLHSFNVANKAFENKAIEGKAELDMSLIEGVKWETLKVTENGVANLSELLARTRENSTALVHMKITADKAQTVPLKYGFSDRVTAFFNGKAIAHNDDSFTNRDYRFLGTVGLFDSLFLPLKQGENNLMFAVTEGFGGWAFLADADLPDGVTIN